MMNWLTEEKNEACKFFDPYVQEITAKVKDAISNYEDSMPLDKQFNKRLQAEYIRDEIIKLIGSIPDIVIDNNTTANQDYLVVRAVNLTYRLKVGKMAKDNLPATHNDTMVRNNVNLDDNWLFSAYKTLDLSLLYSLDRNSLELIKLHLTKMEGKEKAWYIDLLNFEWSKKEIFYNQPNLLSDNPVKPKDSNPLQNPLIAKKHS